MNSTIPTPPEWLDANASKLWNIVTDCMAAAGVPMAEADRFVIARYVTDLIVWQAARDRVAAAGVMVVNSHGREVVHEGVALMAKTADRLTVAEKVLGLTPAARARLNVTPPTDDGEPMTEARKAFLAMVRQR